MAPPVPQARHHTAAECSEKMALSHLCVYVCAHVHLQICFLRIEQNSVVDLAISVGVGIVKCVSKSEFKFFAVFDHSSIYGHVVLQLIFPPFLFCFLPFCSTLSKSRWVVVFSLVASCDVKVWGYNGMLSTKQGHLFWLHGVLHFVDKRIHWFHELPPVLQVSIHQSTMLKMGKKRHFIKITLHKRMVSESPVTITVYTAEISLWSLFLEWHHHNFPFRLSECHL